MKDFPGARRLAMFFLVLGANVASAQATLIDEGGGLVYDTVLDVTWLADANVARTAGASTSGLLNYDDAQAFAGSFVYHDSVHGADVGSWQLPSVSPMNGSTWNFAYSSVGLADKSQNQTSPTHQLAHLFNVDFGLLNYTAPDGSAPQPNFGSFTNAANLSLFTNVQSGTYWSGTPNPITAGQAFAFFADSGFENSGNLMRNTAYVLLMQPGNVAANLASVPVPAALWLFAPALAGLGRCARRRAT